MQKKPPTEHLSVRMDQAHNMRRKSIYSAAFDESMNIDQAAPKTERSHEENQERAYVAASRRTDRSIEARLQSARMASEIHKKRTGKGFKITEDIVLNDEMYEEKDDDLLRSYRLFSPVVETSSADRNTRLEASLSNKVKASQTLSRSNDEWQKNEINRLFAQCFPNAMPAAQQVAQVMPNATAHEQAPEGHFLAARIAAQAPPPPLSVSDNHQPLMTPNNPISCVSPSSTGQIRRNGAKSSSRPANVSTPETSTTRTTPSIDNAVSPRTPVDSILHSEYTYMTDLPAEARVVLNEAEVDAALAQTLISQETPEYQSVLNMCTAAETLEDTQIDTIDPKLVPSQCGYVTGETVPDTGVLPCISDDESWQEFINVDARLS